MKKLTALLIMLPLITIANLAMVSADSKIDELHGKIGQKNQEIEKLEKEIEQYQTELNKTQEEGKTLKNEITRLQTTTNKLNAEINLTGKKIENVSTSIEKINIEIEEKNKQTENKKQSLAEILRELDSEESQSLLEILLMHDSLSDFFANIERMEYLQKDINVSVEELRILKSDLEEQKTERATEKNTLEELNDRFGDQKKIAEVNKNQKDILLKQTQNKEKNYKSILEEKIAKKELFLEELSELETQLKLVVDPNSIPTPGSGILGWPLENLSLKSCWNGGGLFANCVTQFFGDTPFATKNPQVYGGKGHNGVDFRASVGEKILASADGIVEETGNTDLIRGCYSYGQWILIKHNNGLSTLYAHLSLIKVKNRESVKRGQVIGYSGESGYATGPHLHYTVYATEGVKIMKLGDIKQITNCAEARIPIADKMGYLNPLSYL